MSEKYTLAKLKKALANPSIFVNEGKRLSALATKKAWETYLTSRYGSPVDILDADWDTLIVLDACRYDTLQTVDPFDESVDRVVSPGSTSFEWLEATFGGREAHDVVYVSANVYAEDLEAGAVHRVIKTYADYESRMAGRMPAHVTDVALEAHEDHPDKRIIVHYMQPHEPYLGDSADQLRAELRDEYGIEFSSIKQTQAKATASESFDGPASLIRAARDGYVDAETVYDIYADTHKQCLPEVHRLIDGTDGQTVVTADHGELFGERPSIIGNRAWTHPSDCWHPAVRTVPWVTMPSGTRRNISPGQPVGSEYIDEDRVKGHLRDLGYL